MTGMTPGLRYLVTRGSDDGTFEVGDHLYLYADGAIGCIEAQGWIDAADVPAAMVGVEYVVDEAWRKCRRARLSLLQAALDMGALHDR